MNAETVTKNVEHATKTVEKATKDAMAHGQAQLDQMNEKATEVMEHAAKSVGEMTDFTKGNVEAMIASAKAATTGAEVLAKEMAEQAKARFEATSTAWKTMMAAKTPNELFQYQNDFMKSQLDASIAAMSQMTETMLKVAGDVTQPLSNRMALAAEQMKKTLDQR
ncbi:MAG: phasin family protein [Thermaurantiacus sp.]